MWWRNAESIPSLGEESCSEGGEVEDLDPSVVHISRRLAKRINRLLKKHGVVSKSLFYLQQIEVDVHHHFDVTDKKPIYSK